MDGWIFFLIFSIKGPQSNYFVLILKIGTPKYLMESQVVMPSIPKMREIADISFRFIFQLYTELFLKFNFLQDAWK